ncbi:hypothetical protein GPALN_005886 [Globodera pallida]|nr:hypothetical protein GPALN_005886 [Globodera pallida]
MPSQQAPMHDDTFVPAQTGTPYLDWSGGNSQNNDEDLYSVVRKPSSSEGFDAPPFIQAHHGDLESMIRNTSSSEGFDTTPFLLNQLQSTGWPGASNYFSPTPNTSNFTLGNPGSSAIPFFQQAPMPGTSFPSFPNYPSNQSAQLNSSTNFGPSQTETNWSGGNSQ